MERQYSLRLKELQKSYPESQDKGQSQATNGRNEDGEQPKEIYYPWEGISVYRGNMTSLDLVIPDYKYMLALLHVLHVKVFKPESPDFMKIYKQLKLKMKLAYEAWNR